MKIIMVIMQDYEKSAFYIWQRCAAARASNFSRPHDARIEIKDDAASGGKGPPTTKSWKAKRAERRDRNHSIKQGDVGSTDRPRNDSPLGETLRRGGKGKRTSTYTQWGPKKRSREQKR